jgi:hypothetical protein
MKQKKLIEDEESIESTSIESKKNIQDEPLHIEDVSRDYKSLKASTDEDDENYRHILALNSLVYEVFHRSRWSALGPNKKMPKDLIPYVFQDIIEEMKESEFTMVEKFVSICDFMNVGYAKAYELIHMKYKEIIVNEMDQKFGIVSKKKIKKIF